MLSRHYIERVIKRAEQNGGATDEQKRDLGGKIKKAYPGLYPAVMDDIDAYNAYLLKEHN